jgi:hypothetical protein
MVKHNPAYRDGNYVATATPIPGEDNSTPSKPSPRVTSTPRTAHAHTPATQDTTDRPRRAAAVAVSATPVPSKLRQSASAAVGDHDGSAEYAGKTFQQAQEQIVKEIVDYEEYVACTLLARYPTNTI